MKFLIKITDKIIRNIFIFIISFYQKFISPLLPDTCIYYPSCAQYSKEAFQNFGVLKALFLSIKRIIKCNPFFEGGYDPLIKGAKNE